MKKLFFAIGILLSTGVNAQKQITIDGDIAWFYECDTIVNPNVGLNLMSDKSFRKTSLTLGKNHMVFDLEKKIMINDASVKDNKFHYEYAINNIVTKGDTVSFYVDGVSRGDEKIPYRMFWSIILNVTNESDIVWFVSYARPDLNDYVEGQFVKKSMCSINIQ